MKRVCGNRYVGMKWTCVLPQGHDGDCDYHRKDRISDLRSHGLNRTADALDDGRATPRTTGETQMDTQTDRGTSCGMLELPLERVCSAEGSGIDECPSESLNSESLARWIWCRFVGIPIVEPYDQEFGPLYDRIEALQRRWFVKGLHEGAAQIGKLGGASKSRKKQAASRKNGKRGGRPEAQT